jgi:hypothetical protein
MGIETEQLIYFLFPIIVVIAGIYFLIIPTKRCPSCEKAIRPIWRECSCASEPSSVITQEPEGELDFESVIVARPYSYEDANPFPEEGMATEVMLPSVPSAWLLIEGRETPEERYEIRGTVISIGTSDDNDIVLMDKAVSRHHAKIRIEGKKYFIYDLASTNGTRVNGRRVAKKWIKEGDGIEMGYTRMAFRTSASEIPKYKPSDLLRM